MTTTLQPLFDTPPPIGDWAGQLPTTFILGDQKEEGITTWGAWEKMKETRIPFCDDTRGGVISVFSDTPCRISSIELGRGSQRLTISCVLTVS